MKTISIVLTKYSDLLSNLFYIFGGGGYTHISLSLEESGETMYSFNFKGFCTETLAKHRRRGVHKSLACRLQVPDNVYDSWRAVLNGSAGAADNTAIQSWVQYFASSGFLSSARDVTSALSSLPSY